ncbi:hypothetical protein [Maribacter litoralis]|uniref:hypothetical protein n=1 Tax=Maribacter litoralis TaxID=2059726 RepID=UPI003F5CD837
MPNPKDLADLANMPKPLNIALYALFAIAIVSVAQVKKKALMRLYKKHVFLIFIYAGKKDFSREAIQSI